MWSDKTENKIYSTLYIGGLQTIRHPTIENEYGVRITLTCIICGHEDNRDEYDKKEAQGVIDDVVAGKIQCEKCAPLN